MSNLQNGIQFKREKRSESRRREISTGKMATEHTESPLQGERHF